MVFRDKQVMLKELLVLLVFKDSKEALVHRVLQFKDKQVTHKV